MSIRMSFKLKSANRELPSSIRLIIYHKNFNSEGRFVFGTGEVIEPKLFDLKAERPTKNKSLLKGLNRETLRSLSLLEERLNNIQTATRKVYEHLSFNNIAFNGNGFRKMLDEELGNSINLKKGVNLNLYISNYITDIKKGERLTPEGKIFSKDSLKNYLGFKVQFDLFQSKINRKLNFEDITQEFYNDFLKFFNSKNYSPNTIGKHITRLKKIMRSAEEEGLHKCEEYRKNSFKALSISTEHIYLKEKELQALYKLDLSKNATHELYRDVFLIGCYTAQRVSDYKGIKPENLQHTSHGTPILKLIQKKTGEEVLIPIRKELNTLLKKYNYHPPIIHEQQLNEAINQIALKANITDLIEIEEVRGGKKQRRTLPKHELIKSHTARRTGITNMYLAGIPSIDIMKISGHKKESNFLKYIRLTKEETANKLASHPYFNS